SGAVAALSHRRRLRGNRTLLPACRPAARTATLARQRLAQKIRAVPGKLCSGCHDAAARQLRPEPRQKISPPTTARGRAYWSFRKAILSRHHLVEGSEEA